MRLPRLAIEAQSQDLKNFVMQAAANSGFEIVGFTADQAVALQQNPEVLTIWATRQPRRPLKSASPALPPATTHDPRSLYANVVLYCVEPPGSLMLQMSLFLEQIKSGAITANNRGQQWSGYVLQIPQQQSLTGTFSSQSISA